MKSIVLAIVFMIGIAALFGVGNATTGAGGRIHGNIYGFRIERFDGIIIVYMPDGETLWMEALPGVGIEPDQWLFSTDKTVFNR